MKRTIAPSAEETFDAEFLDRLSETLDLGVAVTGCCDEIVWANARIRREFPGAFEAGRDIRSALDHVTEPYSLGYPYLLGPDGEEVGNRVLRGGTLRRSLGEGDDRIYRYFHDVLRRDGEAPVTAHCLLDITPEKHLFETYRNNLHQLSSMREIIDLLYESLGTREVINLILVSVTARQGFGFNRAFFLEVSGKRLRGRLGIGPASVEEAHRIWTRLSESNSSLRETLQSLSVTGEPPDPATRALAVRVDLPLEDPRERNGSDGVELGGIVGACRRRRPALITRSSTLPGAEEDLFRMLGVEAIAVVPLTIRERLAGVLLADNFITRKPISEEDLGLLKTFSGYAALALERSSLYEDLTRNLRELRLANRELQEHHKRLLQAEKLSALGSLAASVSHEIRNPLVAIGGLARSVLEEENLGADSKEALGIIVSEVRRLERFLKETLDFAKPSVETLESVDLVQVVRDAASTFREEVHRSSIEFDLDIPGDPVVASVAPHLIRGAISNLIKNSIEAVEPGARVRVALKVFTPDHAGAEDHPQEAKMLAEFQVADTGPGISDEARELIFEPFFTTKRDGTGIGLAITKQNVRNLGGTITVESAPPFNTVFKVRLPITIRSSP